VLYESYRGINPLRGVENSLFIITRRLFQLVCQETVVLEYIPRAAKRRLVLLFQEIPFDHVWSGTQNGLHCSFTLERTDRTQFVLSCTLQIYQQSVPAARQLLHISANVKVSRFLRDSLTNVEVGTGYATRATPVKVFQSDVEARWLDGFESAVQVGRVVVWEGYPTHPFPDAFSAPNSAWNFYRRFMVTLATSTSIAAPRSLETQ